MEEQNYRTHMKFDPKFHFFIFPLWLIISIITIYGLFNTLPTRLITSRTILIIIGVVVVLRTIRSYGLKVQDRIIRLEEQLRYKTITNKQLPSQLTIPQIIALRFAHDAELESLCDLACKNNLSPKDIKKKIITWRADTYRV